MVQRDFAVPRHFYDISGAQLHSYTATPARRTSTDFAHHRHARTKGEENKCPHHQARTHARLPQTLPSGTASRKLTTSRSFPPQKNPSPPPPQFSSCSIISRS